MLGLMQWIMGKDFGEARQVSDDNWRFGKSDFSHVGGFLFTANQERARKAARDLIQVCRYMLRRRRCRVGVTSTATTAWLARATVASRAIEDIALLVTSKGAAAVVFDWS